MDLLDIPLALLAREIPGATSVFNQHGLSFCSGGKKPLKEAIADAHLDEQQVLNDLLELTDRTAGDKRDWSNASDSELIEHLLERFHQVHRAQLTELHRLAERVETAHFAKHDCPRGLAEHLRQMSAELEQHMQKEEQILFPMLLRGQGLMAGGPIRVMLQEHDEHAAAIARIDELTDGITTPEDACNTWRALYLGLRSFKADLQKHIQLENDILFARSLAA
ncbi:regulator of cell morphogenesis and NO signaling [Microbulbifer donghaiensis]|uniref:Regulator of cell morphogenesis and NO signaling n=1 Tax=Microbulbifer donghaiensis TaxID=494016 RepID=A0A1M4XUY2_9GAMM|nr:iron-sulfur cluster repair protein YtfE [Microbulbifer donghaiensis]SHE97301.1 regulator of cell morphogenesis and NO signaling [Microbulbifer donghaiensis]